jgi:uncharacterized protein YceK
MNTIRMVMVVLLLTLAGCSGLNPLSLLTGGGPNVAANTQLGQENEQTVGVRTSNEQSIIRPNARDITQVADKNPIKADSIGEVNVQSAPPWMIVLLIIGWLAPSPSEIGRWIRGWFRKKT